AARGLVAGNVYVVEVHGGKIEDAATAPADAAVAARPAGATRGLIPREGAVAEGDRPVHANGLVSAALAEAAVSAGPAGAARGLVAAERAVADEEAAEGATAGKPGTGPDGPGRRCAPAPPAPPVAWLPVKVQKSMWIRVGPAAVLESSRPPPLPLPPTRPGWPAPPVAWLPETVLWLRKSVVQPRLKMDH